MFRQSSASEGSRICRRRFEILKNTLKHSQNSKNNNNCNNKYTNIDPKQ